MLRLLLAAAISAVVLFIWGFVSWTVLSWHSDTASAFVDEIAVGEALRANAPEDGVYWLPMMPQPDDDWVDAAAYERAKDAYPESYEEGPVAFVFYRNQASYMPPMTFIKGLGLYFLSALLAALLLKSANLKSFVARVLFVLGLGAFVGVTADLSYWNWMGYPTDWSLVNAADHVVAWLLVGIVLAIALRQRAAPMDGAGDHAE